MFSYSYYSLLFITIVILSSINHGKDCLIFILYNSSFIKELFDITLYYISSHILKVFFLLESYIFVLRNTLKSFC